MHGLHRGAAPAAALQLGMPFSRERFSGDASRELSGVCRAASTAALNSRLPRDCSGDCSAGDMAAICVVQEHVSPADLPASVRISWDPLQAQLWMASCAGSSWPAIALGIITPVQRRLQQARAAADGCAARRASAGRTSAQAQFRCKR